MLCRHSFIYSDDDDDDDDDDDGFISSGSETFN